MSEFEKEMYEKIKAGTQLSEDELAEIVWSGMGVETIYGEKQRWHREAMTVIELNGEYFAIDWGQGLTECQENTFDTQPYPVEKRTKTIEVTEWILKNL